MRLISTSPPSATPFPIPRTLGSASLVSHDCHVGFNVLVFGGVRFSELSPATKCQFRGHALRCELFFVCGFSGSYFRKTVVDSNAPVQEKALDAVIAFLRAADADAGR